MGNFISVIIIYDIKFFYVSNFFILLPYFMFYIFYNEGILKERF